MQFLNGIKYDLINMIRNNTCYYEKGNIIMNYWCKELLDRVKFEGSEDLVKRIEELLQVYDEGQ